MRAVAAIDCGTTRVKAGVLDTEGRMLGQADAPSPRTEPEPGRVEIDAQALEDVVLDTLRRAVERAGVSPKQVEGLALATQRASFIPCREDGTPVGRGISWQDGRGAEQSQALRERVADDAYQAITGLPHAPVFTVARLMWIHEHEPERYVRAERFALLGDWLLHRLGCPGFFCDASNASLTGLLDITTGSWSDAVLEAAGIGPEHLSEVVPSGRVVGALSAVTARKTGLLPGTPLVSGGGDHQCAGVGAGAIEPGVVEITLGTTAVPLVASAQVRLDGAARIACCVHAAPGQWELEGLQTSAGSSVAWMARVAGHRGSFGPEALAQIAAVPPGANGVIFFPYLLGASAPHWEPGASGVFLGLRASHAWPDLARATLEGVSLQTREVLDVFREMDLPVTEVRLTGGCTTSMPLWNQLQADLFGLPVSILESPEASLVGAAILASLGTGSYANIGEATSRMIRIQARYSPSPGAARKYQDLYRRYQDTRRKLHEAGIFSNT